MLTEKFGPQDLLEYNPTYRILICRECRYAIQKSAIVSHLLRHKIYRSERENLIEVISQLNLAEPELVSLPTPDLPPINALPVFSGLRCTAAGCESLYASSKRMSRHWADTHGSNEVLEQRSGCSSRPVKLQTFFRGTKIRYFEVSSPSAESIAKYPVGLNLERMNETQAQEEQVTISHSLTHSSTPSKLNFDLETLTYFHHFTTIVSETLPGSHHALDYWKTTFISEALQDRHLMCGLLAVSSAHLAITSTDKDIAQNHSLQSTRLAREFSAGQNTRTTSSTTNDSLSTTPPADPNHAATAIARIIHCISWSSTGITPPASARNTHPPSQPHDILTLLRTITSTITYTKPALHPPTPTPPILQTLPFRMATVFHPPPSSHDVLATLAAVALLSPPSTAWSWLAAVPPHFDVLVRRGEPPALVVVAHWAAFVLGPAEREESCWWAAGCARRVVDVVRERVGEGVGGLLEGLDAFV